MTCLMGNTENRVVYHNFNLQQLNSDAMDPSQHMYQRYLEHQFFVPPNDTHPFFVSHVDNKIPATPSLGSDKGMFNVFPLALNLPARSPGASSSLGIISQSPLRLELEFEPVNTATDAVTWYLVFTFLYLNRIQFPGSRTKQDVTYDFVSS